MSGKGEKALSGEGKRASGGKGKTPEPDLRTLRVGGASIHLLGTIKGLKSEEKRVEEAIETTEPDVIGLHIHADEMRGLGAVIRGELKEMGLSRTEEMYGSSLSKFGEVQVPPPSLVAAYRVAKDRKIPLAPLDIGDDDFAEAFTKNISTLQLIRQSFRVRKLARRRFHCKDAASFVREWDSIINGLRGYRKIEGLREEHMADNLRLLAKENGSILAVLELERLDGIIDRLENSTG